MTMIDDGLIAGLAQALREAEAAGVPVAPVRDRLPDDGGVSAYAVQRANVAVWRAEGRRVVGRKIGLTNPAVQRQLGVGQPDFGTIFADMVFSDDQEVPMARLLQPKVEAEVALVLGRDLPQADPTIVELIAATAFVLPAIEIVASRIANWDIRFADTVADNASCGLVVLGAVPTPLTGLDLKLSGMVLERNGESVSTGSGAACLGHPLNAALWLAARMAALGEPLKAGDLVLTGALGPMVPAAAGDRFEARIDGVGTVRTVFGPPAGP